MHPGLPDEVPARKEQHLRLAAGGEMSAHLSAGFEDVTLIHNALPEVDFERVDPSFTFLGHRLGLPLVIASMTGGHPMALEVNRTLARAASRHGVAMGVGSQRAALVDADLAYTYSVARQEAPDIFLMANIGAPQLVQQRGEPPLTSKEVRRCVEMIDANALIVHLNALQEVVQPEGQTNAVGWTDAIARLVEEIEVPLIVKETGAGISRRVAERLATLGVAAIDIGGRGGTSFAAIESARALEREDRSRAALGETFRDWGIPTAASLLACRDQGLVLIATGGIRNGLDAAKALALGARLVGVARPALQGAIDGSEALDEWLEQFALELRAAMFLTGSLSVDSLRSAERVLSPALEGWTSATSG